MYIDNYRHIIDHIHNICIHMYIIVIYLYNDHLDDGRCICLNHHKRQNAEALFLQGLRTTTVGIDHLQLLRCGDHVGDRKIDEKTMGKNDDW